jgi:hypothetical protein
MLGDAGVGWERHVRLRDLLDQGLSKRTIGTRLGLTRSTLQRWIATGELDRDLDVSDVRYTPRPRQPVKLDPFVPLNTMRFAEYLELTAVHILAEIRSAGYTGGVSQLRALVARLWPATVADPSCGSRRRPATRHRSTSRYHSELRSALTPRRVCMTTSPTNDAPAAARPS